MHDIPKDGRVEITFPKWNSFETQTTLLESFVSTSTSPGVVPCAAVSGISVGTLACEFTHGETTDLLQVFFKGKVSEDVTAGSAILFTVEGVRGPPSTSPVSGFSFQTTSVNGDIIDRSAPDAQIELQVTIAATGSALGAEVTSSNDSINFESDLTIKVAILNPLPAESNIVITIPDDFDVSGVK